MSFNVIDSYQTFWHEGVAVAGGTLTINDDGTSNAKTIYSDDALSVSQSNPYTLNAYGQVEADVKWSGLARYVLKDSTGATLRTVDNVSTLTNAVATATTAGLVELATDAETVTGTATDKATTPANIAAKMSAPGVIGNTTPAAITGTAVTSTTTLTAAAALITGTLNFNATGATIKANSGPKFIIGSESATNPGFWMINKSATAPNCILLDMSAAAPDDNTSWFLKTTDLGTARSYHYSDGDWYNHDGTYGTISDEKLKEDIQPVKSYWDDFSALEYKSYKMTSDIAQKGDKAERRVGLIAQDVEKIFPKLVPSSPDEEKKQKGFEKTGKTRKEKVKTESGGELFVEVPVLDDNGKQVMVDGTEPRYEMVRVKKGGKEQSTKMVKSSILEGPIMASVVQECQARIVELEADNLSILARLEALESNHQG